MRRAHLALVAALLAAALASCRDVPSPDSGVLSVSPLQLPSPAVVVGDTMRDSVGAAAPLRLVAYGVDGEPVDPQPAPTFVLLDPGAHLAGAFLIGDATGSVRVIGSVSGLQTQSQAVLVTLRPDTLVPSDSTHQLRKFRFPEDTAATADLNVRVQNTDATPTGVDGVIVRYELTYAPPVVGTGPSVLLLAGSVPSTRDTTANGGTASRTIRLRLAGVNPTQTDSAMVSATASYRGQPIGIVQFTIVFQPQ
jgi:hypothetical protein